MRLHELGFEMRETRHERSAYIRGLGVENMPNHEKIGGNGDAFHREESGSMVTQGRRRLTSGSQKSAIGEARERGAAAVALRAGPAQVKLGRCGREGSGEGREKKWAACYERGAGPAGKQG